VNIYQ